MRIFAEKQILQYFIKLLSLMPETCSVNIMPNRIGKRIY